MPVDSQVCYGPVWYMADGSRRPAGSSKALCDPSPLKGSRALTMDAATVNCPACLDLLAQRAAVAVPGTGTEVVDGSPEGPGGLGAGPLTPKGRI